MLDCYPYAHTHSRDIDLMYNISLFRSIVSLRLLNMCVCFYNPQIDLRGCFGFAVIVGFFVFGCRFLAHGFVVAEYPLIGLINYAVLYI